VGVLDQRRLHGRPAPAHRGIQGQLGLDGSPANELRYEVQGQLSRILHHGMSYLDPSSTAVERPGALHTEGLSKSWANIYLHFALAIDAKNRGDERALAELVYPDIDAGLEGVRWLENCVKSANNGSSWVPFEQGIRDETFTVHGPLGPSLPFERMLDEVAGMGVEGVEMTVGGWWSAPHLRADELLADAGKRRAVQAALESRSLQIAALNVPGNPLDPGELGAKRKADTDETIELAGHLGVKKIVMMSGLPPAAPGDRVPNWITYTVSWPATLKDCLDYQWNEVAIPYWRKLVAKAKECGVEKFALENFTSMLVWNPEALFRLRADRLQRLGFAGDGRPDHVRRSRHQDLDRRPEADDQSVDEARRLHHRLPARRAPARRAPQGAGKL
jgi:sugar phosphate isomerase/epimerase